MGIWNTLLFERAKFTPSFHNFRKLYNHNNSSCKYKPGMELIVFTYSFYCTIMNTPERLSACIISTLKLYYGTISVVYYEIENRAESKSFNRFI